MFEKLVKLLKNIQFWSIVSAIAAIISVCLAIPKKQTPLSINASYKSKWEINDTTLNIKGDSLVILYAIPMLGGSNYFLDYCIVDFPLSISTADDNPMAYVNVYGYSTNYDDRTWDIDSHGRKHKKGGKTYSRFDKSSSSSVEEKIDYSTFDYTFNNVIQHRNYRIPTNIRFFNPNKKKRELEYYEDGGILDEFNFDLRITEPNLPPRNIKIHNIGVLWIIDQVVGKNDPRPFEHTFDSLTNIYPNALAISLDIDTISEYWMPIDDSGGRKYAKFSSGEFWHRKASDSNSYVNFLRTPDFSKFWTWYMIIVSPILLLFAIISWIPNLCKFYRYKIAHKCNNKAVFKSKSCNIDEGFELYADWIGSIIAIILFVATFLVLFTNF